MPQSRLYKFIVLLSIFTTAHADPLELGLSVGYVADGTKADNGVSVLPYAFYDNERFYIEGGEAGVYAYKDKHHHARLGLGYDGRSFNPSDAKDIHLNQLNKRKSHVTAQASYMLITPVGGIRAKLAQNLGNDGMAVSLAHVSRFKVNKAILYPSAGITWHNKEYNRYHYGINEQEAQKSGLGIYTPNDSISPFVSLTALYDVNDKIGIMGNQRLEWLGDSQKASPLTDGKLYSTTRIGVHYKF